MYRWLSSWVKGEYGQGDPVLEPKGHSKMKIWVRTITGKQVEFDVSNNDTVESVMQRFEDAEGVAVKRQRMVYGGKQMEPERTLYSYEVNEGATISLVLRTSRSESHQDTFETSELESHATDFRKTAFEPPLSPRQSTVSQPRSASITFNTRSDQGYDDDEVLLHPECYYDRLDELESMVVEGSAYYRNSGKLDPTASNMENADSMYSSSHCSLDVWRCFDRYFSSKPPSNAYSVVNLGESYLILSRMLDMLETLSRKKFGIDSFTILIRQSNTPLSIASLVEVERAALVDFHDTIGDTILGIFRKNLSLEEKLLDAQISERLLPGLENLAESLGFSAFEQLGPSNPSHLCRILVLVLDLGLVSYMGSHGTRFDQNYLGVDHSNLIIADASRDVGFRFFLQRLACLDSFLDGRPVWTFQLLSPVSKAPIENTSPATILTTRKALADTWGPLWSIPAGKELSGHFKQLNVGKGQIRRIDSGDCPVPGAVSCHWFESSYLLPTPSPDVPHSMLIHQNQKLLIGGPATPFLQSNRDCTYSLDSLERDYGLHMTPLGTSTSSWVYDERQIGFSASQYVGITVMGTQKKLPSVTLKQAVRNKWTNQPTRANPRILNSYLGVEISHCTGNARRAKLRDIFAMTPVQTLLERQFPDWKNTEFGPSLQQAFHSTSDTAIEEVWVKQHKSRIMMAELICCVLEMLEKTGMSKAGFNAAFINQMREFSMPIQPRLNHWAEFLEDSHLTAVYAIINNNCLTMSARKHIAHPIALCTSRSKDPSDGVTILETQIAVPQNAGLRDKIWLNQRGYFQCITDAEDGVRLVTWESGRTRELGNRLGRLLRSKQEPDLAREIQDSCELGGHKVQVLVKSTMASYGGLPSRKLDLNGLGAMRFEDSLEIRSSVDDLEVGGQENIAAQHHGMSS